MTGRRYDAELLVLGGGPVGLYASYRAGFRGLSGVIIDSLPRVGGQVAAIPRRGDS